MARDKGHRFTLKVEPNCLSDRNLARSTFEKSSDDFKSFKKTLTSTKNNLQEKIFKNRLTIQLTNSFEILESKNIPSIRRATAKNIHIKEDSFENLNDIIPEWLTSREDFKVKYNQMKKLEFVDLSKTVRTPVLLRSEDEKNALFQ